MTTARRPYSAAILVGLSAAGAALLGLAGLAIRQLAAPEVTASPAAPAEATRPPRIAQGLARMPVRIAEHVYVLGDLRPSAVYVVDTSDGLAMVDTGLESSHETLLAGMSKLGLAPERLKIILLTHAHGDHSMGAQRLRDDTGAKVYIGRGDAQTLRRGGPWEAVFSKFDMQGETLHPTTIDGELTDQQVIELGRARFTVVATPGHTPGSCCFLLEIDGQRLLFTGDTISTFTVSTGTYSASLPPRYGGDVEQYLQSLEKLRNLPAPDMVLPGHPASDLAILDPRLTSDQWQELAGRGMADLKQVHDRYVRDGGDFLDGHPKQILDGLYYLGDFDGHAACALLSGTSALLFDGVRGTDAERQLSAVWQTLGLAEPTIVAVAVTSCEADDLTGLRAVVEKTHCRVIAPPDGLSAVSEFSPDGTTFMAAHELPALGCPEVNALPIFGASSPQAAYHFRLGDRTVLISGRWPLDLDLDEFGKLVKDGPPEGVNLPLLTDSLENLQQIDPDIWISKVPRQGRNANLYDRDWPNAILWNLQLLGNRRTSSSSAGE